MVTTGIYDICFAKDENDKKNLMLVSLVIMTTNFEEVVTAVYSQQW